MGNSTQGRLAHVKDQAQGRSVVPSRDETQVRPHHPKVRERCDVSDTVNRNMRRKLNRESKKRQLYLDGSS